MWNSELFNLEILNFRDASYFHLYLAMLAKRFLYRNRKKKKKKNNRLFIFKMKNVFTLQAFYCRWHDFFLNGEKINFFLKNFFSLLFFYVEWCQMENLKKKKKKKNRSVLSEFQCQKFTKMFPLRRFCLYKNNYVERIQS